MTETIAQPYNPEAVLGEWGWLWHADQTIPGWVLCRTIEGDEDEDPLLVEMWMPEDTEDMHSVFSSEDWVNVSYLPLSAPSSTPQTGLMVAVHYPGGSSATMTWEGRGTKVQEAEKRINAAVFNGETT